jgi:ABC-type tungstate transport system permease subunit
MYNDFVLVGPKAGDPAKVRGNDIAAALKKLAASAAAFVSRGDKSGTHAAELRLWKARQRGHGRRQARRLQGMRLRHGPGAEHRARRPTPTC